MPDRHTLEKLIDACGLGKYSQTILDLARPSIRLTLEGVADPTSIPVGASRIGGDPDLPVGAEFPEYEDKALDFVAQINLAEIASLGLGTGLPDTGMLYFFYLPQFAYMSARQDDLYSNVVLFAEAGPGALKRTPTPKPKLYGPYKPCTLSYNIELTIPARDSRAIRQTLQIEFPFTSPEGEGYDCLYNKIWHLESPSVFNRMLGYPNDLQGDVFLEADGENSTTPGIPDAQNWLLLLQVDSDNQAEMMWGDTGMLCYCIREEDLAARRFDKIICILQEL